MRARQYVEHALKALTAARGWDWPERATVEPPRDKGFGDLACNAAMMLAGAAKMKPRQVAEDLAEGLRADPEIAGVEVAGPGFLNVTMSPAFWRRTLAAVHREGEAFGFVDVGHGRKVQVEYVSANPTGPLHIGHGRGAALGDSLARILARTGHDVQCEYYLNDAGRQMRILGESVLYRARQIGGQNPPEPEDYYRGDYVEPIAKALLAKTPGLLSLPEAEAVDRCRQFGMDEILEGIKQDLRDFRVRHDNWFSEKSLLAAGRVEAAFAELRARGMAYDKDGAFWFKTTELGDDKDRVLRKSTGELTYFASDIAYHADKFRRGFDLVVDIWGADHHGYVPRMQAAVEALGRKGSLEVILVQLVTLLRGGEPVAMSTRAGEFETLHDVVAEVGADAARFIFLSRKSDSKLDFDLELVKQQSMDNPVYYVQYAAARVHSLERKAAEQGLAPVDPAAVDASLLDTPEDLELLKLLDAFHDALEGAAKNLSPHLISFYLQDLASSLHKYYTVNHVLSAEPALRDARRLLLGAVARVVRSGLDLLGVETPDRM
ncbi:MAG: arginine--tRNA ligase [Desulfovibrionaceae bacterium]